MALLQAYRGLAAMLIAVSHLSIAFDRAGSDALGWVHQLGRVGGVDFFFVLSGFLIYRAYSGDAGVGRGARFLRRRLLRIYPLVWIFTLLSLPIYAMAGAYGFGDGHEFEPGRLLKSLLLWPDELQPILGATWSLRHVVAFYLVFAAFLRWPAGVAVATTIWAGAVVVLGLLGRVPLAPPELAFIFSPFNLAFPCGCLLAAGLHGRRVPGAVAWLLGGTTLFVLAWTTRGEIAGGQFKLPLYIAGTCLLIVGAQAVEQRRRLALPRWMDALGDASYAMVVVNLPVVLAAGKLLAACGLMHGAHVWWAVPLLLALVVATALFTHVVIEKPLARWLSARVEAPASLSPARPALRSAGWR